MKIPSKPSAGMVVRYAFLWSTEAENKRDESVKERPCLILSAKQKASGRYEVLLVPITHTPNHSEKEGLELPPILQKKLGLQGHGHEKNYIKTSEINKFTWVGPDLRPVPGHKEQSVVYGMITPGFFEQVKTHVLEKAERTITHRPEVDPCDEWRTSRRPTGHRIKAWSPSAA